jgi:hypothetical protein
MMAQFRIIGLIFKAFQLPNRNYRAHLAGLGTEVGFAGRSARSARTFIDTPRTKLIIASWAKKDDPHEV